MAEQLLRLGNHDRAVWSPLPPEAASRQSTPVFAPTNQRSPPYRQGLRDFIVYWKTTRPGPTSRVWEAERPVNAPA